MTDHKRRAKSDYTRILEVLGEAGEDFPYFTFDCIASLARLPRQRVRFCCRAMARKGLTQYGKGLWTDDGRPAGSGYAITESGRASLNGGVND